jgi:hypothetical protein
VNCQLSSQPQLREVRLKFSFAQNSEQHSELLEPQEPAEPEPDPRNSRYNLKVRFVHPDSRVEEITCQEISRKVAYEWREVNGLFSSESFEFVSEILRIFMISISLKFQNFQKFGLATHFPGIDEKGHCRPPPPIQKAQRPDQYLKIWTSLLEPDLRAVDAYPKMRDGGFLRLMEGQVDKKNRTFCS